MVTNIIIFIGLMVLFCLGFFIGLLFGIGEGISASKKKKKRKSKYPPCDCKDVNQCTKSCYARHAFNKDFQDGKI